MAQLAERSRPIPEVRASNPDNGKFLYNIYILYCIEKTKEKKKVAGNGLIFLKRPERGLLKLAKANT